jgi:hypothetical protein
MIARLRAPCVVAACLLAARPADAGEPARLPDTDVTRGLFVAAAWLTDPTDRYAHGVLGDALEAGGLAVTLASGRTLALTLPSDAVFEDRRVRLHDLDGDGREELIVVRSSLAHGAALTVYAVTDAGIVPRAETEPLGAPNRWLNPAGIADFDGDGRADIAYVDRPHVLGRLVFVTYDRGGLVSRGAVDGVTNHVLGSRELDLAVVVDWGSGGRPLLVLPARDRHRLVVVGLDGDGPRVIGSAAMPASVEGPLRPENDGRTLAVRLSGGRTIRVVRDDFAAR